MCNFLSKLSPIFLLIPVFVCAQINIDLPSKIAVSVNGQNLFLPKSWADSLVMEAGAGNLKYEIVSAYRYDMKIETKIYIPPFFPLSMVYRQIVFYYAMLSDEKSREAERILIYPYYSNTTETPWISCSYESGGKYQLRLNRWQTSKPPDDPKPEEKYIYNQIIEHLLDEMADTSVVPEDIFEKVARENDLSVTRVREIYQIVRLWRMKE